MESAFTLFRQHGGKARRQRKRARDKAGVGGGNEEAAIVAAIAKTGSGGGGGDIEDDEGRATVGLPPAQRAKVSINIFEDVDDRWVDMIYGCSFNTAGSLGWLESTVWVRVLAGEHKLFFLGGGVVKPTCSTRVQAIAPLPAPKRND